MDIISHPIGGPFLTSAIIADRSRKAIPAGVCVPTEAIFFSLNQSPGTNIQRGLLLELFLYLVSFCLRQTKETEGLRCLLSESPDIARLFWNHLLKSFLLFECYNGRPLHPYYHHGLCWPVIRASKCGCFGENNDERAAQGDTEK